VKQLSSISKKGANHQILLDAKTKQTHIQ